MKRLITISLVLVLLCSFLVLISCNVKVSYETQANTSEIENTKETSNDTSTGIETTVVTDGTESETTSHSHSYGEWIVFDPTCEDIGHRERHCTCGEIETETIPATGHTPAHASKENVKEDSCTEAGGYDMVVRCSICGKILSSKHITTGTVIDHTPGEEQIENKIDPTCTNDGGYDIVRRCKFCGVIMSSTHIETKATGHKDSGLKVENVTEPTCTEDGGYDKVHRCTICGEILSSTHTITKKATGHNPGNPSVTDNVEPTCTEDGYYITAIKCTKCGDEISSTKTIVPATGHVFENGMCKKCGFVQGSEGLQIVISDDKTYAIVTGKGTCKDTDIKIPSIYEGLPVTRIEENAFQGCDYITSLTISPSIKDFGVGAFFGCTSLKSMYIFDLESWLNISFATGSNPLIFATRFYINGTLVTDIVIPDGFEEVNDRVFDSYKAHYTIVLPNSIKTIGYGAFYNSGGLHEIVIPDSVTTIGQEAFCYNLNLTSIVLGKGLTSIGENAFKECEIQTIYYTGTSEEFAKINIAQGNDIFKNVQIIYNYQP